MLDEMKIKEQICEIGRRIYNRNMVAANDGNISVKLNDHEFLCTPTGVSKGFMTPDYICKVDEKGNVIEAHEGFKPSSEIKHAAAPSPNIERFPLSEGCKYLLYVSAVNSKTLCAVPDAIKPLARAIPYIQPEQPKSKSNAPADVGIPRRFCKIHAVDGRK